MIAEAMPSALDLLQVVRQIRRRRAGTTLDELAARAGWSSFHLHRAFRALIRETPKQYTLRLQMHLAATRLVSSDDSILDIALGVGFNSHEVFTRAFRRHFGVTPGSYRARALAGASVSTLSIERREVAPQHILFVRLKVARHELASAIGEGLGQAFPYSQRVGVAIAGRPFTRYQSTGPGLYRIDVGLPVATATSGESRVESGTLPGGPVAVAVHAGSYDTLTDTYAALERWIEANGYRT